MTDLKGPKQNYAVKGWSIQNTLYLVCETLEKLENLAQSKTFHRVDHRFLSTVLKTTGFKPEFYKWIKHDVPQPAGSGAGEREVFRGFRDWAVGPAGLPLSPLLYVLTLEPLLRRFKDEKASPALCDISLAGPLSAKVSAYANDITVFVSRCLDIKAVKKAFARYGK